MRSIDFNARGRAPVLGWALLLAGMLLSGIAWHRVYRIEAQREEVQSAASQQRERLATLQAARNKQVAAPLTADQKRRHAIEPQLAKPWHELFEAIESARVEPVYLLSLAADPVSGDVRLDAEAPSFEHALAFVQRLDHTQALTPGMFISHEMVTDIVQSRTALRFSVSTRWISP